MAYSLSITESNIFSTLRSFVLTVVPAGVEVMKGQQNRVPQPIGTNYVEITPILQERLATNIDSLFYSEFTGSIALTILTITTVTAGQIIVGAQLYGANIAPNTIITAFGTGTGGLGTYVVSASQTAASGLLSTGSATLEQETQVTVQMDVFGPGAADNAQAITTLFRDDYAVELFAQSGYDIAPLYTGDPQQFPFVDSNQQVEARWHFDIVMQANPVLSIPLQSATSLKAGIINVDATYAP